MHAAEGAGWHRADILLRVGRAAPCTAKVTRYMSALEPIGTADGADMKPVPVEFSSRFDRAVAACADAQAIVTRAAEAAVKSREMCLSASRVRHLAVETHAAWKGADLTTVLMRRHVAAIARAMRDAGMNQDDAAAAVRAHIRFVLYDGGLREREAEPVVQRANACVADAFRAA